MPIPQVLSGSTNGKPIPVVATGTLGTTIHTATSFAGASDQIFLWVNNVDSVDHYLTIEFGAAGTGNHSVDTFDIPANSGPVLVCPGLLLQNSLVVTAFADSASKLNITGFVYTILPQAG